jgi:hypothetical protein
MEGVERDGETHPLQFYTTGAKTTFIREGCRLPISREFLGPSTILSIDPTICVATQTRQVPTVSPQAVTAAFSASSTRLLPTLTEASIADGMDMLEVGLGDMTDEEYEAHFSMWAEPSGKSAHRISRNLNVPKDKYGQGEIQV